MSSNGSDIECTAESFEDTHPDTTDFEDAHQDTNDYDSDWSSIARFQDEELKRPEPFAGLTNMEPCAPISTQHMIHDKKEKRKGKKTFGLPLDRPAFETFIDHGTTLDSEGYPLFPNGSTVFVKQPGQILANWCTFGFSSTTSGGGIKQGSDWRTVRFTCLGVTKCNSRDCDYLGAPPTSNSKRSDWEKR